MTKGGIRSEERTPPPTAPVGRGDGGPDPPVRDDPGSSRFSIRRIPDGTGFRGEERRRDSFLRRRRMGEWR